MSKQVISRKGRVARPAKQAKGRPPRAASVIKSPWKPAGERARDRVLKRDAVLQAAAQAYNRRGYHNASLDDIARQLHVSKATIYYYLENKEETLYEICRMALADMNTAVREIDAARSSGLEKVKTFVRKYCQVITTDFGTCVVRIGEGELSPATAAEIKRAKAQVDRRLRRLIEEGIEDGSMDDCDPQMTAFALAGAMNWIGHWYSPEGNLTPDEIAGAFIKLFVEGLRHR